MTIREFRSTPELVSAIRTLLENETLRLWLDTLDREENPSNFKVADDVTPHYAHVMLGFQTGYGVFKHRFLLGGQPIELPKEEGTSKDQNYLKSVEEIEAEMESKPK